MELDRDESAGRAAVTEPHKTSLETGPDYRGRRAGERAGGGVFYTRRGVRCHEEAETSKREKHNLCDMSCIPEDKRMKPCKTLRQRRFGWMTSSTSIHPSIGSIIYHRFLLIRVVRASGAPPCCLRVKAAEGHTL